MAGRLSGIARHDRPKGPMEAVPAAFVSLSEGVRGDYRGALAGAKPLRKRQVSLIERESWEAALADCGALLDWWHSRRNLLVEGLRLPRKAGTQVLVGSSTIITITGECDPCDRMDALHAGLRAAMTSDWRGGFIGRVEREGNIAIGDTVRIME